jgi:two-component system sensor histidine kinase BarA
MKDRGAHRRSLRARLALLVALCAGSTALFGVVAVLVAGVWFEPERIRAEAGELAGTLAYALEVPLAFEDDKAAAETLSMLRARSDVRSANVYDKRNRLVARYAPPTGTASLEGGILSDELLVERPIGPAGQVLGRIELRQSLYRVHRSLALQLSAILTGALVGLAVALVIARTTARRITDPVVALADASTAIAQTKDYSRRLEGHGDDEVGNAVDAFNRMLDELQIRDRSLEAAVATLEARVVDRTRDLRREKERAESASRAKTTFLANMSHELRTPLNAVIGAAQLLEQSDFEQSHLVEIVRSSGINLLGLIENVLDVSRIEAGELPMLCEDFNLGDCLEVALATTAVAARAKGLAMCGIIAPELPVWCNGDAMRLRQVVINLLSNSVKFTARGEVVLRATPGSLPGNVRVSVVDTGIGIEASKHQQIFEPFRQGDETTTRRFGGTGLGLAISRRLVNAMGGEIQVCSAPHDGAQFVFEIPLSPPATTIAPAAPLGHEVLYFEPHASSAEALSSLLARSGCQGERIYGVDDLRSRSQATTAKLPWLFVATDTPDCVELLEFAAEWIAAGRLIEMTKLDSPSESTLRSRFGLPRGLVKPVMRGALVSRLGVGVGGSNGAVGQLLNGSSVSGRILVVEDDPTNQLIVASMLRGAGYDVLTADDGQSALALLREHSFNLVLMDWQMPDMDGLTVTRLIRAGAVGSYGELVPIVALTANAFADDRTACLAAGMNDFLTKPILARQLLEAVERWILRPSEARQWPSTWHGSL